MPSGAKKRKAAKKKKVHDSSTTNPHQGENNIQDSSIENEGVEVEKREDTWSENNSKVVNEDGGKIETETGSKSKSSHGSSSSFCNSSDDESRGVEKNVVVLEPVPVTESLSEKIYPIIDPVDSSLEAASNAYDETKNEVKKELVVKEQPVVESVSLDEKDFSQPKDYVASSTSPNGSISEMNGADRSNETDIIAHSDRQPRAASMPLTVQKTTSWKGCCGLFELFSGPERN